MQIISNYLNHLYPLPISIQKRIDESCNIIQFDRNDNIDIVGKTPEFLLLVKSGLVQSLRRTDASKLITGFKGPGDLIFNVRNLFKSEPTEEGFKAVQNTTALAVAYTVIHDLLAQYPNFALNLFRLIDLKLIDLQLHADILAQTTDRRILSFSEHFANFYGDIPKQQICRFLRISRTTFYDYANP